MNIRAKSILAGAAVAGLFFIGGNLLSAKKNESYTANFKVQINPAPQTNLGDAALMDIMENLIRERGKAAGFSSAIKSDGRMVEVIFSKVEDSAFAKRIMVFTDITIEFREMYMLIELPHLPAKIKEVAAKYTGLPVKKEHVAEQKPAHPPLSAPVLQKYESGEVANIDGEAMIAFAEPYIDEYGRTRPSTHIGTIAIKDSAIISKILHDTDLVKSMPQGTRFYYGLPYGDDEMINSLTFYAIALKGHEVALLRNEDIDIATSQQEPPQIILRFNSLGTRKWAMMTSRNIGRPIAIIVNNAVVSAPIVLETIEGGMSAIDGTGLTMTEMNDFARQLSTGTLPATVNIVEQKIVKEKVMFSAKSLLLIAGIFIIATGVSWFIFNPLKTS